MSDKKRMSEAGGASGAAKHDGGAATPMMAQYAAIKAEHPGCLLFYRMGDFFELFFEDAEIASQALGIQLTKRGRHLGEDIPMCGVPVTRAEEYLHKLIAQGFRVAVCDQLEDPAEAKKRGAKSVVKRGVIRLVTAGTLTEDNLLDERSNNFLTALFRAAGGHYALASLDISTGEFFIDSATPTGLSGELARLAPSELLISDAQPEAEKALALKAAATPLPNAYFNAAAGEAALKAALGVADLGAFGSFARAELAAAGALLKYVEITQIGKTPAIRPPKKGQAASVMAIDAATRASLELMRSSSGERAGSLLASIDRTVTSAGARELAQRLSAPLIDPAAINERLDAVEFFLGEPGLRDEARRHLKAAPDIARALSRLKLGRGSPRDLGAIRDGLEAASKIASLLGAKPAHALEGDGEARPLRSILDRLAGIDAAIGAKLKAALEETLPILVRDGGFVREGYRSDLDEARALARDGRSVIARLEAKYAAETGVKSLKIRHNNVLGYFIEVTAGAAKAITGAPLNERFQHRQTVSNAMRFASPELSDIEARMGLAAERALAIETEVFEELRADIISHEQRFAALAAALAELDVYAALAFLADEQNYARPVIDSSLSFAIEAGRHPCVEQALKKTKAASFIANDCRLSEATRLWIVTGPNMAGKSTFLRQNALIAILAQMGSFVPAASAHIGIVDKLFSRVGASDDLARGRSTFMVEMVETAAILNQATERSLVILDEIGRGTATFDGLSIAWACLEYLHDVNRCRALFATHYHELTALAGRLAGVANATMTVREWKDEIVFLHQVREGAADRSYGIQVAKLAGLPEKVVKRARAVLASLEDGGAKRAGPALETLPLFAAALAEPGAREPSEAEKALADINPDDLSPREALEALYRLKALI